MVIRWSKIAALQLRKAFVHIKKDSYQNAIQVRHNIIAQTESLSLNPERFPIDKYKTDNNSSYRAFEIHRYRISNVVMGK